jgi:hypothetical protein
LINPILKKMESKLSWDFSFPGQGGEFWELVQIQY